MAEHQPIRGAAPSEVAADALAEHVIGLGAIIHRLPAGSTWRLHLIDDMRLVRVAACCLGHGQRRWLEATRHVVDAVHDDPAWDEYEPDDDDRAQELAALDELAALLAHTIRALPEYHEWRPSLMRELRAVNEWTGIPTAWASDHDDVSTPNNREES